MAKARAASLGDTTVSRKKRTTVLESPDPVVLFGPEGHVLAANEAARDAGVPAPAPEGEPPVAVFPFFATADERRQFLATASATGLRNHETRLQSGDGPERVFWISSKREDQPERGCFVAVARDVSEKSSEHQLISMLYEELASRTDNDPITGLATRDHFRLVLEREIEKASRSGTSLALLVLDLDNFKSLNDTHGMSAGDEYLGRLADGLKEAFQKGETLGRVGGDEIAVLVPGAHAAQASVAADRIVSLLARLTPIWEGRPLNLTGSVGGAIYPDHALTASALFEAADIATHQAKRRGPARFRIHDPSDPERERLGHLRIQADRVREALVEGRFVPVYQPVSEVLTGRIVSVETLVRLRQTDGSFVAPDQFLEAAERFGYITAIDRCVIAQAFDALTLAHRRSPDLEMAVNLSGHDFEDDTLVADISRMARNKGIRPERVTFEITETAALRDLARVQHFTQALVAEGFRFALDDFGIGFSSFKYLRELPVSTLKFDISYVKNLPAQMENRVFVRGIAEICRSLGVKTVAEGVESSTVLNILKELGVDRAQGHYVGRPAAELPQARSGVFAKVKLEAS